MKFLHLSDLHIHTHESDNVKVRSMLNFISQKYPDHRLIVTGDITDDGAPGQYENANALLQPFKDKIFICPGNHDFGAAGNFYSHERALRFDNFLAKQLNQGGTFKGDSTPVVNRINDGSTDIMLIALDSNLETEHPFDFACGKIGEYQLNTLKTILSTTQSSDIVKILILHHHPFIVNNPFMELKDAKTLARVVYGRIDLILFGHKHTMDQWENIWGTKYILASDNSPGKAFAKEITIDKTGILPPKSVPITEAVASSRSLKTNKNKAKKSPSSS
jgi:3',5'-cyclic AMP phosphodiesterase CpdA